MTPNTGFPDGWISAAEMIEDTEDDVTVFNDHGTIYVTGGERTDEWLWMNDIPPRLENGC